MGRLNIVQCATAVALVAILLQYAGFSPRLFGVDLIPKWPYSRTPGESNTINAVKLLADLNSDLSHAADHLTPESSHGIGASPVQSAASGQGHPSGDTGGNRAGAKEPQARAASAALSVMYLAAVPGLREQVKRAPGIVEALLRHASRMDLAALRQSLLEHHQEQQQSPQAHQEAELLSASLLALAKLVGGDPQLQAWLLDGPEARPRPGGSKSLPEGALLARVEELLRSGVPAWQAAASVLLYSLAGDPPGRSTAATSWVSKREEELAQMAVALVETGAHYNSTDVALSGCQLLELIGSAPGGRRRLLAGKVPRLAMQLVVTHAGLNSSSSSSLVAGAARLLRRLVTSADPASPEGRQAGGTPDGTELGRDLVLQGAVAPLVREVRVGQRASLGPSLALLAALMAAEAPGAAATRAVAPPVPPGQGPGEQVEAPQAQGPADAATAAAVSSGILSICSQLLFKADLEGSDKEPRLHCSAIVRHVRALAQAEVDASNATGAEADAAGAAGGLEGLEEPDGSGDSGSGGARGSESGSRGPAGAEDPGASAEYASSEAGRASLAEDLLALMSSAPHPDLHNALVEALRDVAPSRQAAEALVRAGAGAELAALLGHNLTAEVERGTDPAVVAWLLQTQRSAAAVLALFALQGGQVREQLAAHGVVEALAAALAVHSGQTGLMAQVRVTAAAALVPMLGADGRYDTVALAAGVLEPLVAMHRRGGPQERLAATRVLRLLARDPRVAAAYEKAGVKL